MMMMMMMTMTMVLVSISSNISNCTSVGKTSIAFISSGFTPSQWLMVIVAGHRDPNCPPPR